MAGIVEAFDAVYADLRSVIRLSPGALDIRFVCDALDGRLSDGELERLFQNVLANQVSASELWTIGDHGEFFGQCYRFEECVIFQFPAGRHAGWVVSFDDTADFPVDAVFEGATHLPPIDDWHRLVRTLLSNRRQCRQYDGPIVIKTYLKPHIRTDL